MNMIVYWIYCLCTGSVRRNAIHLLLSLLEINGELCGVLRYRNLNLEAKILHSLCVWGMGKWKWRKQKADCRFWKYEDRQKRWSTMIFLQFSGIYEGNESFLDDTSNKFDCSPLKLPKSLLKRSQKRSRQKPRKLRSFDLILNRRTFSFPYPTNKRIVTPN